MRVAISGTHCIGKTTLSEDFVELHPEYVREDEPYHQLEEQGASFSEEPTVDGMLEQLDFSIELLGRYAAGRHVVFERCPIDFIAYIQCIAMLEGASGEDLLDDEKLEQVREAIANLDLIVFLPLVKGLTIESEERVLRRAVDRQLKEIYRQDPLGLFAGRAPEVVEISGTRRQRVEKLGALV